MRFAFWQEIRFIRVLAALLTAYAAMTLAAGGVALTDFIGLIAGYVRMAAGIWVFTGAVGVLWLAWRHSGTDEGIWRLVSQFVGERWNQDRCLSMLTPPLLFALLMATFNTFKQRVLPQVVFGMDVPLAAVDRALFFGVDPWRLTHSVFASPWASWAIDLAYHAWFAPMALGVMICAFLPASANRLRLRYLISYVLLWVAAGSVLALALPAAGPCFQPTGIGMAAGFEPLMDRLHAQNAWLVEHGVGNGLSALHYQQMLLALHGDGGLAIGGGISAMPSIHNALAVLFAIAAFQLNRPAGIALSVYAGVIWVGSVHLGWHYAVDGPVGAAAAWGAWRVSAPLADWLMTRRSPRFVAAV